MNFVGHAIVARWEDDDPRHGAGAMLPDLARMCGVPTPPTPDEVVRAGVRCHLRVDAAFHDGPQFLALMRAGRRELLARGVPRAASLAAAHVGVELLLDGAWLAVPALAPAFHAAARGAEQLDPGAVVWPDAQTRDRFASLVARLPEIADGYASPEIVGERLVRILARRPRLAPGPAAPAIRAWVVAAADSVRRVAERVLDDLHRATGTTA